LGTVDLPQKADVRSDECARALGGTGVALTFRTDEEGQKSERFQRGLSVL